MTEKLFLHAST